MKDLHFKIKQARMSSAYKTQKALAERLGVSHGCISQWETEIEAARTLPDLRKLAALAEATGKSVSWFFGEDTVPTDPIQNSLVTETIFFEGKVASFNGLTPEAKSDLSSAVCEAIERKGKEHSFLIGRLEMKTASNLSDPGEFLNLTMRTRNILKECDIDTVDKLCSHSIRELLLYGSVGRRCVNEIREALASKGLRLKGDISNEVS